MKMSIYYCYAYVHVSSNVLLRAQYYVFIRQRFLILHMSAINTYSSMPSRDLRLSFSKPIYQCVDLERGEFLFSRKLHVARFSLNRKEGINTTETQRARIEEHCWFLATAPHEVQTAYQMFILLPMVEDHNKPNEDPKFVMLCSLRQCCQQHQRLVVGKLWKISAPHIYIYTMSEEMPRYANTILSNRVVIYT